MGSASHAALLQAILDTAVDGIITIDVRGIIRSANLAAEGIFQYSAAEMQGNNISMLMPEPYRSEHDGYLQRYLASGNARIIGIGREVRGRRKDGSTFPMNLGVSEVQSDGETVFTGIVQDITARRNLEDAREALIQQLEDVNTELERFTYTVSHDLKSPLITIRGFLSLLEKDIAAGDRAAVREDVQRIGAATDKMGQLLDELLDLSRVGRVANVDDSVAMEELTHEVLHLLQGSIDAKGVEVDCQDQLPVVTGDRVRLREVLQNLLENALKFMGENPQPKIEIRWARKDTRYEFRVADNGMGIEPQYQERVFGLFEQLDGSLDGTGIGLALVKRIIECHSGEVWLESPGLGHGTEFCFTLPVPRGQLSPEEERS